MPRRLKRELKGKRVDKTIFAAETDDGKDAWYIIAKAARPA